MKNKKEIEHLDTDETLPKKVLAKLPEGFFESSQSMSAEELKKRLVDCETTISSVEKDMENDQKLNELKEDMKALNGGYKDLISPQRAMIKCIVFVLNSRGNS